MYVRDVLMCTAHAQNFHIIVMKVVLLNRSENSKTFANKVQRDESPSRSAQRAGHYYRSK